MRAYVPVSPAQARTLLVDRRLPGPLAAWVVDPQWRAGAPDVAEEEWEYVAAELAATAQASGGADPGIVLAVEVVPESIGPVADGSTTLAPGLVLREVAAAFTADLAWYGVQELNDLLDAPPRS